MSEILIFRGSPRGAQSNTNALTDLVSSALKERGHSVREFDLPELDIRPCTACRACQRDWTQATCVQKDDLQQILQAVESADLLILATPVYSWYCTPPTKALLDRLVYAMNMYYGAPGDEPDGDKSPGEEQKPADQPKSGRGPALWAGKSLALITTCGYPIEKGADLLEEGIRRYCKHSQLVYRGMLAERHLGYDVPFLDDGKRDRAERFALRLLDR